MKNKRVVVTGGSGFIGSHLVDRLVKAGAKVAVTVRYGNEIKNERLKACWNDITILEVDLRNRGALTVVGRFNPDYVFHLAAYNHVGGSFHQVEECFDVNAKGTANVLDTLPKTVKKFIYMSTSEVYGKQSAVPFVETMNPQPISPYSITKYAGEMYCRMTQGIENSVPIAIVRAFNTFGPYQSSKAIIPELIGKCLRGELVQTTKGEQTREFNFVSNIVEGLISAALSPKKLEGPINLASGVEVKICDLVRLIAKLTHSTSKIEIGALAYRPTEIWRMYADNSRAKELLGWSPEVTWEEGIRQTVEWYRHYIKNEAAALLAA